LTVLRMFRLFRILKTQSYMRALDAVYRVVYYNSEILYVAALICLFLTVSTAMLLYILRPEHDEENDFGSILATLYMSTMMLTGQGGPGGELPWYTKAVVLLTSVFSVAMFAIPASMLTWGFEAEAERMATAAYKKKTNSSRNDNSSSSSSEGDTTDDEYFKLLAGGGDDDGTDEEEPPWMKEIRESFENADINHVRSYCVAFFSNVNIGLLKEKWNPINPLTQVLLACLRLFFTGRISIPARDDSNDVEAASTTFTRNDCSH